ncbi:MAG: glycosyltransferase family 2 protein [Clostridiales bacterium]|nr:glycosyltransferase family 2 protein [Clostridiales bacterium]
MKKVCVIIPNFNGAHFLDDCLTSLYQVKKSDFDCLVVDNGSTDDSLKLLQTKFPQVEVLSLKENTGFCHAVNRGVQKAGNPYVILLNNDTVVLEGFIEALIDAMEQSPKLFSVSSKMLSLHNKDIIDDCGDLYTVGDVQQKIAFFLKSCILKLSIFAVARFIVNATPSKNRSSLFAIGGTYDITRGIPSVPFLR